MQVIGGSVSYLINGESVSIVSCDVKDSYFEIPDMIEGFPVTELEKKALLSNKVVQELVLPKQIERIGDWAFAHCSKLEKVWIPRSEIRFGKGIFKDCRKLQNIHFLESKDLKTDISELLAAVPVMLAAEYLLSPMEAGDKVWFEKFDARVKTLMDKPDEEGYSKQILCGEEDLMASLDVYLANRRKQKAKLCFMRLLHDLELKQELRTYLETWLCAHTKGCESEASWEVVLMEHGSERAYYEVFAGAGCITRGNFDLLLADMTEQAAEMKAWLLRYQKEHMETKDFFEEMTL